MKVNCLMPKEFYATPGFPMLFRTSEVILLTQFR